MCKFIGNSNERILCEMSKSEILRLYSIVHVVMKTTKMSNFTCQWKFFVSIFFTCQVSACDLQPFSCHDLENDIYSQTAKTVFRHLNWYKCFLTQNFSPLFCDKYLSYLLWSLFYGRCRDAQENNNESFLPCSFGVVKVKLKRLWQNDPRFAQVKFWCAFVLAFSSDRINKLTLNCLKYSETWTIYKAENIYLKNLNGLNTRSSSEYWPSVENVLILLFQYIIF